MPRLTDCVLIVCAAVAALLLLALTLYGDPAVGAAAAGGDGKKDVLTITLSVEVPDDPEILLDGAKISFEKFKKLGHTRFVIDELRAGRGRLLFLSLTSVKPAKKRPVPPPDHRPAGGTRRVVGGGYAWETADPVR